MVGSTRATGYIAMLLSAWLTLAPAQTRAAAPGWDEPIGSGGRALDAALRLFPGAALDGGERLVLAREKVLRLPGTSAERAPLPAGTRLQAPSGALHLRSEGRRYTVLLWEGERPEGANGGGFGEGVAVLAVVPEGQVEPTDVAEVKRDRFTGLGPRVDLGAEDGFLLFNTHHNAGQGYQLADLFHLRGGRLRRVVDGLFTLSASTGCRGSFEQTLAVRTEPDGAGPRAIVLEVERVLEPPDQVRDCPRARAPRRERFADRWRWDAGRGMYRREGGTLDRLVRWNERRM